MGRGDRERERSILFAVSDKKRLFFQFKQIHISIVSRDLALTRSPSPTGLDQRSLWCEKSQNASGSTRSYSSHHLPRDSPQTQAHCPTVCIPGEIKRLKQAAF